MDDRRGEELQRFSGGLAVPRLDWADPDLVGFRGEEVVGRVGAVATLGRHYLFGIINLSGGGLGCK